MCVHFGAKKTDVQVDICVFVQPGSIEKQLFFSRISLLAKKKELGGKLGNDAWIGQILNASKWMSKPNLICVV